jgi:hypothetical protein
LQARARNEAMSPLAEFDQRMEQMIRDFALRIIVPRWTEFDDLWEAAIRVCDRYELGKPKKVIQPGIAPVPEQLSLAMAEVAIPSAADCIDKNLVIEKFGNCVIGKPAHEDFQFPNY